MNCLWLLFTGKYKNIIILDRRVRYNIDGLRRSKPYTKKRVKEFCCCCCCCLSETRMVAKRFPAKRFKIGENDSHIGCFLPQTEMLDTYFSVQMQGLSKAECLGPDVELDCIGS